MQKRRVFLWSKERATPGVTQECHCPATIRNATCFPQRNFWVGSLLIFWRSRNDSDDRTVLESPSHFEYCLGNVKYCFSTASTSIRRIGRYDMYQKSSLCSGNSTYFSSSSDSIFIHFVITYVFRFFSPLKLARFQTGIKESLDCLCHGDVCRP